MKDKFFGRHDTLLDALSDDDCGRIPLITLDLHKYIHLHYGSCENNYIKIILLGKEFLGMKYDEFRSYCSNLNWGDENFLDVSGITRIYDLSDGNLLLEIDFYDYLNWSKYLERYNPTEYAMIEKDFSLLIFKLLSEYVRSN